MRNKEVLSLVDAARICNVSHMTMWRWVKNGKIKTYKTLGGHNRILWRDMERFLVDNGMENLIAQHGSVSKRILFISHESSEEKEIAQNLQDIGFTIEWARDEFEAGRTVSLFKPDCVILNLSAVEINAQGICRALKRNASTSAIKVVALTGNHCDTYKARNTTGADICLAYSDASPQLTQKIANLLR